MTKRRKSPPGSKRKSISSSRGPQKTPAALPGIDTKRSPGIWDWRRIVPIVIALGIAAIPFGYGRYFEINSPGAFDSGSYVYSAYRILHGAQIGVDEIPSAKLGTLLVNMLGVGIFGYSDIGPKIIQGILQAAALVFMLLSLRRIYGVLAGAVAITVAAIYLSSPAIAKFGNVKEQYMIAFMVMGISAFLMRQAGGRWFWSLLAGGLVAWAPLFKETGVSAIAALGLFVLIQPILKHRTLKQTGLDIGLLFAGAILSMAPIFIWLSAVDANISRPYAFVWQRIFPSKPAPVPADAEPNQSSDTRTNTTPAKDQDKGFDLSNTSSGTSSYIGASRRFRGFKEQFPIVMRFYRLLILPIALSLGALVARLIRFILSFRQRSNREDKKQVPSKKATTFPDRFVFLFVIWWLLDMAFVWISPRSYDQYYLPQNASGAMLGAYLIGLFSYQWKQVRQKSLWLGLGAGALVIMGIMVWPIFVGVSRSPHTGLLYRNYQTDEPEKRRGYAQKLEEIANRKLGHIGGWEIVARQVKGDPDDDYTIYVWGWYPGIYVAAGRVSSTRFAFESDMHILPPLVLAGRIWRIVTDLQRQPPRYIIDSQKMHYPNYDHPVFDLWPRWWNKRLKQFDLRPSRIWKSEPKLEYVTLDELYRYRTLLEAQVEEYCLIMLTSKNRQDGPLPEERAEVLARQERDRHIYMHILREFVMKNYHPIKSDYPAMFIFERNADKLLIPVAEN